MMSLSALGKLFLYILYNCSRASKDLTKILKITYNKVICTEVYQAEAHRLHFSIQKFYLNSVESNIRSSYLLKKFKT